MNEIKTKNNSKIKHLRKLKNKKYRQKYSEFLIENFVTIKDAFKSGYKFKQLFVTSDFFEKNKLILEKILIPETYLIDNKINKHFSDLNTPSGICALYDQITSQIDLSQTIIYLNAVNDPGNLGTILRSALAFDLKNIVLDEYCVDLYNYKVLNASKDAIFKLNIEHDTNLKLLKKIKTEMKIYSTSLNGDSNLKKIKTKEKFCLILGNESHGVSKEIQNLSNAFIKINMNDEIESLSVSSASAILFYTIYNNKN